MIGGVLPTVLLGLGTVLMKLSMREGSSVPNYLAHVGAAVLVSGLAATWLSGGWVSTPKAAAFAGAMGFCWACAIGLMAYAVTTLQIPLAILSPLTNSNALVALSLSLLIFNEWHTINVGKALLGTVFIVAGAIIVSTAKA